MNALLSLLREGKCVLPLRLYHALSTLLTLAASCVISSLLVFLLDRVTGSSMELSTSLILCSSITVLLSGAALAWEAGCYIRPAKAVVDATGLVAKGDFSIRVPTPDWRIGIAEGYSLIENFNRMTKELSGMEHMRRDFTGSVSHEFKTPLSSIVGFTEILMENGIEEKERKEYLALLHEEALRLSRLAENLLQLSRLDAQGIVSRREEVALDEQIRQCVILLSERWDDKGLSFSVELPPMRIETDPDMTKQVWLNLIDNAVKYSRQGGTLHISGRTGETGVFVCIRDEGIGIPPEKLEHIFEPFYQCEESHKEKGHGLGLSIVRRIAELLGGTVECRSKEGEGTEMTVALPLSTSQKAENCRKKSH